MNDAVVIEIGRDTLSTMLLLMGPPLTAALVIGVTISVIQAATQIQEMTLALVPKLIGVFLTLAICGSWMTNLFTSFSQRLFAGFPDLVR